MARMRYLVRVDPEIWADQAWAERCSIAARCAYFDSLFFLASLGEPDGLYPHTVLAADASSGCDADSIARQLTAFGVWEFAGLGYRVRSFSGCRIVPARRQPIPENLRSAVYERDGYRCVRCGSVDDLTLDHVYPWILGGPDTLQNLRTLCRGCNSRKGAKVLSPAGGRP